MVSDGLLKIIDFREKCEAMAIIYEYPIDGYTLYDYVENKGDSLSVAVKILLK